MDEITPNMIVGERELLSSTGDRVLVRIGKPQTMPNGEGFYCPYQITGLGNDQVRRALAGIDTINTVQITLQKIGIDLRILSESRGISLRWEGGDGGDLGFPLPPEISRILTDE